jgi:hypothetical protein
MKISIARIKQIINEEQEKLSRGAEVSLDVENLDNQDDAPAEAGGDNPVQALKNILEKWEETEYESDGDRWEEYHMDIKDLVEEYEGGEKEEHTEEECEEVHPNQSHEEWEEKDDDGDDEKKEKKKESKPSSGSKSKSPKLAKMTYESKKKKLSSELVRMIKEELTSLKGG